MILKSLRGCGGVFLIVLFKQIADITTPLISCTLQVSYFVSIFPYILLTVMLVRGVTLEGASKGVEFYMNPDFSRLGDLKVSTIVSRLAVLSWSNSSREEKIEI